MDGPMRRGEGLRDGREPMAALLTSSVNLHVALNFAALCKASVAGAAGPTAPETTAHLLQLLQMVMFAMLLQLLIILESPTTNGVVIPSHPTAEERVLFPQHLWLSHACWAYRLDRREGFVVR